MWTFWIRLLKLKLYWNRIYFDGRRKISINYSDEHLTIFIANWLPPAWVEFIDSYVGGPKDSLTTIQRDPFIPSQQSIRIVKDEYIRRETEKHRLT
jgi:hypothetical protein